MQLIASLSEQERVSFLKNLSDEETADLYYDQEQWARPNPMHFSGNDGEPIAAELTMGSAFADLTTSYVVKQNTAS